ncbi:SdrD B-like domain-containing protein [Macrococcus armenti]|uniref:SdrD B-like domain-containing protein n=1 Tax=Macrococcus armenti TaxID=2875764 RepID=UPI001CCA0EBD|nr:SdrD B-like domain-containing protein [Macrococcus armenti]UBH13027.1 YSIRK-type signal peptide-containing protein [Macrococcus armenti]
MNKNHNKNVLHHSFSIRKSATGVTSLLLSTIVLFGSTLVGNTAQAITQVDPATNDVISPTVVREHTVDGFLSFDENRDGISDIFIPNIKVELLQNGSVIASTTTNSNGYFVFNEVPTGTYELKFIEFIVPGENLETVNWSTRTFTIKLSELNSYTERTNIVVKRRVPTTEQPTTEAPTTEAPTTEAPTTEQPTTEAPTTEAPTTEQPTTEQPTTEAPTTEAPTTEQPTTETPTTEAPTTEQPTTETPTTEAPTTEQPTTETPTTEAPTTEQPTTEAPTTEAPTTEAPTTEELTTEAPTTEAPTAEELTTEAPTNGQVIDERNDIETKHRNHWIGNGVNASNADSNVNISAVENNATILSGDVLSTVKTGNEILSERSIIFKREISKNTEKQLNKNNIAHKHKDTEKDNKEIVSIVEPKSQKTPPFKNVENKLEKTLNESPRRPGELRGLTTFASSLGGLMLQHKVQ